MDIPYRTFATRSSRPNERFEQLSRGNVSGTTNGHSSRPPVSSSRKRVNVVTFRSTPSPVPTPDDVDKDVLPPLTKQPRCTTPVAVPPPAPLNIPTSVSTKHELRSGSENSLAATPLIAPKFRRVEYTSSQWRSPQLQSQSLENYKSSHRNGPTQVAPLKPSTANQRQKLPSSQPSKLPPPTTTNQKPEAADPYAWVEEEEPEPKPSEFAVREEDEVDDGVKPWFWPASREAAKQMTPSNTKATVKTDPRAINRIANDGGGAGGGDTKPRKIVVPRDQKSPCRRVVFVRLGVYTEGGGVSSSVRDVSLIRVYRSIYLIWIQVRIMKVPSEHYDIESAKLQTTTLSLILYTVVEKVKDPSECQERGEVQHALDDMNYLIDGLSDTNSTNTRCLSVLTLANKCLTPATRDVIHAYGLLKQICANLHDAHTDYDRQNRTEFVAEFANSANSGFLDRRETNVVCHCQAWVTASAATKHRIVIYDRCGTPLSNPTHSLHARGVNLRALSPPSDTRLVTASSLSGVSRGGMCRFHKLIYNHSLGLTAAGLFFVLSRDRDPDLLTSESLAVLLKLLHAPNRTTSPPARSGLFGRGLRPPYHGAKTASGPPREQSECTLRGCECGSWPYEERGHAQALCDAASGRDSTINATFHTPHAHVCARALASIMENASVDSATSTGSSKYTIGAASRQTRLNKEASQIRTRVQQLLEAVAAQQQKRSQKQQETPVKSPQPAAAAAGMAALFVRKNPGVASLFSGASGQKLLNARHLRMNRQLTARDLVLEAVLNLSTRKAAPWFKSGIRTGGGLDGVAEATIDAVDYLKDLCTADDPGKCRFLPTPATHNPTGLDDFSLDNLKRVGYYAKMLENMTYMNSDNQTHLVRYKERALIDRLVQCIHLCASRLPRHPPPSVAWVELLRKESEEKAAQVRSSGEDEREQQQPPTSSTEGEEFNKTSAASASPPTDEYQQDQQTLLTCLLSIFRLFVNVSHSEYASDRLGGCPGLLEATLDCLFHLPDRLPSSRRFDLLILILCLLANLCEHCPENRIRIVHLEVRSSESVAGVNHGAKLDNVGYEDDEGEGAADGSPRPSTTPTIPTVSALDEVVKLFLYREKKTLMHEFERDDEEGERSERKSEKAEEADSTTTTATSTLQRPKPPPSLLTDDGAMGETIEEAGLKWRLVGGNRHGGGNPLAGGSRSKSSKRSRLRAKRRRRRQALLSRGANKKTNFDKAASSDDEVEEDDDEDEEEEDDDELCSDEDESDGSDEEDEYDEDDELCGGADVEFVTETQEEQEKLKERMSSANQHMEDSVVAAYASLLLGCILQSSPRYAERIRARLPEPGKFRPLAIMLAKLLSFLSLARGVETAGSESILRIVRTLEAQDQPLSSTDSQASTSSNTLQPPTTRSALRARHV
ncbi:unnamed protein product [Mesocestoides corti]|uniref:WAPL domain-containing protein n=1 Tax=Mesocestoides corti TaxID=53468 RepID=A0A158QU77_MESCO|nr:unnamed protein product [Mesocestoides corti]